MTDEVVRDVTFSEALEYVKRGGRAARAGWNGKDMWIAYGRGNMIEAEKFWNPHTRNFALSQPCARAEVLPYLLFKTADNKILMGWLASQTDMLAQDWCLIPPIVKEGSAE